MIKIYEIMDLLPHRFPFLLVDRVEEVSEDLTTITAYKNVTANEPQFTGHFPGAPVMPGVLIIEAMAQTCGILAMMRLGEEARKDKDSLYYFAGIDKARFKRVVLPGDRLVMKGHYLKDRLGIGWFECEASVDGNLVCKATLMCARRKIHE
ncbi:3-hydroxyacyl-ACP dehydratase FabZ [Mesosutterella sp. AGMB02718]|uniref:3-hydroxyacyl-[acyl-carrier-protein] dehydratase FabZ n=1 Tax=Mesosutterella faecium TaxID=2925194 RepID=A0ABT7IMN3_9BURK|nr:3-hydroxyacyl-ACP dehydratase FabZ [Mesosutterella sp. AGMB02718]MDL2059632.1 3-hydroxyacyl-ACP dehydratase FabZ [Mesosutterella sp. AGMB02718]